MVCKKKRIGYLLSVGVEYGEAAQGWSSKYTARENSDLNVLRTAGGSVVELFKHNFFNFTIIVRLVACETHRRYEVRLLL